MGVLIWGGIVLVFRGIGRWWGGWRGFLWSGGCLYFLRRSWGRVARTGWRPILLRLRRRPSGRASGDIL